MTQKKGTKRALLLSILALVMCCSMLIGSTYAWFTDSVTSTGNVITSGTLNVTFEWADGKEDVASANWKDASKGAIFDYANWEPGYVAVRHIKIANDGTLALKYQLSIEATGTVSDLSDVIDVYYIDPAQQVAGRADLSNLTKLGTLTQVLAGFEQSGAGTLEEGQADIVTLALKMQESAGNDYQDKEIGSSFKIKLFATQLDFEEDTFDNSYDEGAEYPLVTAEKKDDLETSLTVGKYTVKIPEEAEDGQYSVEVTNEKFLTNAENETELSFDVALMLDGDEVEPEAGVLYDVYVEVGTLLNITEVTHNGSPITFDYSNGIVHFVTDSFSPFAITYKNYKDVSEDAVVESNKIVGGIFTENPAKFDETLDDEDSEYIAINYVQDGKTKYIVAERATTLIVDDGNGYVAENNNYTVKENLASTLSTAFTTNHTTVYILPGTYASATTLTVASSKNIIGLGDAKDIKLIKLEASSLNTSNPKKPPSNRHLFNVNGATTLADHIHVTISNLYLDATAENTYKGILGTAKDDNAAVQAIRMSKVKCYDLIINDDNYPFYVNGKYDARGAYMYVEDCSLIGNIASDWTPFALPCALYYSNLTYANGTKEFTTNNNYYTNTTMAPDDWDWEN